jgi:hypothetical protein
MSLGERSRREYVRLEPNVLRFRAEAVHSTSVLERTTRTRGHKEMRMDVNLRGRGKLYHHESPILSNLRPCIHFKSISGPKYYRRDDDQGG